MHSILRVEHKDTKRGPYIGSSSYDKVKEITDRHCEDLDIYPLPEADIGIERDPHCYELCGFKDVKQLTNWFTKEELAIFKEEGFIVKRLSLKNVEVTEVGERQILFCYKPNFPAK